MGTKSSILSFAIIVTVVMVSVLRAFGPVGATPHPNILLIIADDLGVETLSSYGVGQEPAVTPNLDQLAQRGIRFDNFWAQPVCSPTRATVLTGRYGFRTGVTFAASRLNPGIRTDEFTLFQGLQLGAPEYSHALIGKWHLQDQENGGTDNPGRMGIKYYAGSIRGIDDYFTWSKTVNGKTETVTNYHTTELVDDAIHWVRDQKEPWFLWLAFAAPHRPFHKPPAHLLNSQLRDLSDRGGSQLAYYRAMIEAMDTEIGRLFAAIGREAMSRTDVIFMGDNGSPRRTATVPFSRKRAKGTVYEGGIRVPLIVAGPTVQNGGRNVQALVNSTDLFRTILDLAGADQKVLSPNLRLDSVSLVPYLGNSEQASLRQWVYADIKGTNRRGRSFDDRAVRNDTHKLIRFADGHEELYDLVRDPFEANDLLARDGGDALLANKQQRDKLARIMDEL